MIATNEKTGDVLQFTKLGDLTSEIISLNFKWSQPVNEFLGNFKNKLLLANIPFKFKNKIITFSKITGVDETLRVLNAVLGLLDSGKKETFTIHYEYISCF